MSIYEINMDEYKELARKTVAEGCVLLKNENKTLPLKKGDRVALFGRMAEHYYKSGLGSGGLVNTRYVVSILDALSKSDDIRLDKKLLKVYRDWNETHPLDQGHGWGTVPWNQEEMPLEEALVEEAAEYDDAALVVIARTAGEDQDNANKPGSFLLTDAEHDMIQKVARHFERTAVLLNVGNIIDMSWVEELNVPAVMYVWQGGQEGGNGVCDVLTGIAAPSGRLTSTIAKSVEDYPSAKNFGDADKNIYEEDIYVGYRYFETFARDRVLYPFGYGLSYSTFEISGKMAADSKSRFVNISATVLNTGEYEGKEVVQVYVKAPQGRLGKAERVLVGFDKTRDLLPEERTTIMITVPKASFASFDDSGVTGHKNAYVLEEGTYEVYIGANVRDAVLLGSFEQEFEVVAQLEELSAPAEPFKRIRPESVSGEGDFTVSYEDVPVRTVSMAERIAGNMPEEIAYTGDRGIKLADVYHQMAGLDDFIAQLSPEEHMILFRGEGMSCPKVTPGTGSGFGGLSEALTKYGIPAGCTTDGPSGLRLDCGTRAFSLPNGTCVGSTFNTSLIEELYCNTGKELRRNRVDALLGPGLNIQRNPLCGRNFEYISEDPFLTGKVGAALCRGLAIVGSCATIKHFCANNQEYKRNDAEGVISQRALREIYWKGFEISVKEGKAKSVMTTYGPVNGMWTASNYDLNTMLLRREWGFDGIVMTDWWAKGSTEDVHGERTCRASMLAAGNDLYMVCPDQTDMEQDDLQKAYREGRITMAQLQENSRHILKFLLESPAMLYEMGEITEEELALRAQVEDGDVDISRIETYSSDENGTIAIENPGWDLHRGESVVFATDEKRQGMFGIRITIKSDLDDLAQLPLSVSLDNVLKGTMVFQGSSGASVTQELHLDPIFSPTHYVKIYAGADGIGIERVELFWEGEFKLPF